MDSRYLSYLLRHHPEDAHLTLDEFGWCNVENLLKSLRISMHELEDCVNNNTRFIFSTDKKFIKAAHGHSIPIKYTNEEKPPEFLYHGTSKKLGEIIKKEGLKKMTREAVHLSADPNKAISVGSRHAAGDLSKTMLFTICALDMYCDGYKFYKSEDGVWLTDNVPAKYLEW